MKNILGLLATVRQMQHSEIGNYILPGLLSSLVGGGEHGKVRLFEATRVQRREVTPHSHRFSFACLVLQGFVINEVWTEHPCGEEYSISKLIYNGEPGEYKKSFEKTARMMPEATEYYEGDCYYMSCNEVHSITFSEDAIVLFFEGVEQTKETVILEPCVNGETLNTFKVEDWMFKKEIAK